MNYKFTAYDLENPITTKEETYNTFSASFPIPPVCPSCSTAIEPKTLAAYYLKSAARLYVLFLCTKCNGCFLATYKMEYMTHLPCEASFLYTFPSPQKTHVFSEYINEHFPQFVDIYNQSERAENAWLDQICGLGYRKALEFLVKDYAILNHPEEAETIKKMPLASCIEKYIVNLNIRHLAKASAWVGNDAAHYIKKHSEYSVEHLKAFILAIISYIDSEYQAMEAQRLLSADK